MKHYAITFLLLTAFLTSCERSQNGDLDGLWYITRIDSIQQRTSVDLRGGSETWAFQAQFAQFYNYNFDDWNNPVMARLTFNESQIIIDSPFIYDRVNGDIPLTADSTQYLRPYYLSSIPDTFDIEKLTRKELRISDNVLRLYFDRY